MCSLRETYPIRMGRDYAHPLSPLRSRDLSRKGTEKRQEEYVERTLKRPIQSSLDTGTPGERPLR